MSESSLSDGPLKSRLCGIQHVGITVENVQKSLEFYTEVLGGKLVAEFEGLDGDGMHNTLLQKEELDGLQANLTLDEMHVPDLRSGKHKLDVYFVQFENVLIELVHYRDSKEDPKTGRAFPVKLPPTNPAYIKTMHISFYLKEDVDPEKYVTDLEAECQRRGMKNVRCNRTIQVLSEKERQDVPSEAKVLRIPNGFTMFYCKGPDGEQLEFNQLKGEAKEAFDKANKNFIR